MVDSTSPCVASRNSRTSGQASAPPENKAQERFGNAKSISSAQVRILPPVPCSPKRSCMQTHFSEHAMTHCDVQGPVRIWAAVLHLFTTVMCLDIALGMVALP